MGYERQLALERTADHFIRNCIQATATFTDANGKAMTQKQVIKKVRDAQILFDQGAESSTMWGSSQRDSAYESKAKRDELRDQIVAELIQLERLGDDEDIELGKGGGKPKFGPKKEYIAILLTGLPASGKSTVVAKVADHFGAYVVDPDFAKRKFPEYDHTTMGASLVHLESMAVTLGKDYTGLNLWQATVDLGFNLVRPMVGDEREKVDSIRDELIARGYKVHLTTIDLDRELSSVRALQRFLHTDRYVSLSYIFDECANDASLVYYRSRIEAFQSGQSKWTSVGIISTSGTTPRFLDNWGDGNPAELFKEES